MKEEISNKSNIPLENRMYSYRDMLEAFEAGRKHYLECGNTNSDCWDFITWMKDNYIRRTEEEITHPQGEEE